MTKKTKLSPCPCCGAQGCHHAVAVSVGTPGVTAYFAQCSDCGLSSKYYETVEDAVAAWNRRPKPRTNFDAWKERLTAEYYIEMADYIDGQVADCTRVCPVSDDCPSYNKRIQEGLTCADIIKQWANAEVTYP